VTDWLPPLLAKLDRLRAADPAYLVTGASEHRYRFGPRASDVWLTYCEQQYGIRLPEQFRRFLLEVGNGGCGPWHGLRRFGYLPSATAAPQAVWSGEQGEITIDWGRTRIGPVEFLPDGSPTDGFEVRYFDAMRALAGGDTILAEPFPFTEHKVTDDGMRSHLRFARERWPIPGAWWLSDYGCGTSEALVLNGPRTGEVWTFDCGGDCGAARIAGSFADWYDAWLDDSLDFCARSFNYRRIKSLYATNDRSDAEVLLERFQSAAIRSELEQSGQTVCVLVGNESEFEARRIMAAFNAERRNRV
jgi:hypothetical protein